MQWIGWLAALLMALGAGWFLHAWRSASARANELFYEKIDLENELDTMHAERVANPPPPPPTVQPDPGPPAPVIDTVVIGSQLDELAAQIEEYRACNRAYDAAIQHCLQPVEMLIGADPQTQAAALGHINAARKPLFAARQAVQKASLNRGNTAIDAIREGIAAALVHDEVGEAVEIDPTTEDDEAQWAP